MTELEELKRQKREIEEQIKRIMNQTVRHGHAKLELKRYPTCKPDDWRICIAEIRQDSETVRFWPVIWSNDRNKAIKSLDVIIDDLQGLREKLKKENR